jgi:uroporphyrinogen-III synthase
MSPLAGRRIVITRAADQADATAALVMARGATPVVMPLIDIVDDDAGMAALARLSMDSFDWIAVTSPNGARRVAAMLRSPHPKLAAVGRSTAAALQRCDLVADVQSAAGLLRVFPRGPGRALVVQAAGAEATLVNGLIEAGWDVTAISAYRTVAVRPSAAQQIAALSADAVLFASGSAVRAWAQVFGTAAPPVVVAIGHQTVSAAERVGLKISTSSADHSIEGMLAALETYLSTGN